LISFRFGLREAFVPLFDIDIHVEVERLWNVVAGSGENDFRRVESGLPARIGVAAECEQSGHRVSLFPQFSPSRPVFHLPEQGLTAVFPRQFGLPGPAADASTSRRSPRRVRSEGTDCGLTKKGWSGALTKNGCSALTEESDGVRRPDEKKGRSEDRPRLEVAAEVVRSRIQQQPLHLLQTFLER